MREKTENYSAEARAGRHGAKELGEEGPRLCINCRTRQPFSDPRRPKKADHSPRRGPGKVQTRAGGSTRGRLPASEAPPACRGRARPLWGQRGPGSEAPEQTAQPAGGAPRVRWANTRGSKVRLPRLSALLQAPAKNPRWGRTRALPMIGSSLDTLVLFLYEAALSSALAGMGSLLGKAVSRGDSTRYF